MSQNSLVSSKSKPVAIWLLVGVFMIMIQVWLGGITRLTGSGLSITQWDPIMGAIPPLNHAQWMEAFHKYQQTPQYHIENSTFTLRNFKSIFFWEWFHRLWARLLGVVFLVFFILFLIQKRFSKSMVTPMIILFLLGGLQGVVGWIMVESGLVGDNVRVNHLKLAAHFITAMVLLCYTFWFALQLLVKEENRFYQKGFQKLTGWILGILVIQLIYGSFMAGLHAALAAHTWPSINSSIIPPVMFTMHPWLKNFIDNDITVQFIHRGLAYILLVLLLIWWIKAQKIKNNSLLKKTSWIPLFFVLVQITLGILTVVNSLTHIPVVLAVSHQFVAMLLLLSLVWMFFISGKKSAASQ